MIQFSTFTLTDGTTRICSTESGRTIAHVATPEADATVAKLDQLAALAAPLSHSELLYQHEQTAKALEASHIKPVLLAHAGLAVLAEERVHRTVDDPSVLAAARVAKHVPVMKAADRFTLGPVYVPDQIDAHDEHIDADTLQKAIWDWVRAGDRTIFLQHTDKAAGEQVEILTWPSEIETSMTTQPDGAVRKVRFPAGTPFMGVIWTEAAWELVKAGELRGYSIGGKARRVEADLPDFAA